MKRILSLTFVLLLIIGALFVAPADAAVIKLLNEKIAGGELSGYVDSDGYAVINDFKSDKSTKELVLPETMEGYTIKSIVAFSFEYSDFTKITLPAKLTSVREYCFSDSKVEAFVLPQAFENIGAHAFSNCEQLESIDLSNVKTIGEGAFSGCENLTEVKFSDELEEIGSGAFNNCKSLADITLPKNLKTIGSRIFKNASALKAINVDSESKYFSSVDGVLYNKKKTRLCEYPNGKAGKSFTVPEGVKTIAPSAFENNKKLKKLILPDSLEGTGKRAMLLSNIEEISFSGNPVTVGAQCFYGCEKLVSIDLKGVTKLGNNVFEGCDKLSDIKLSDDLVSIGKKAFSRCESIETIYIPKNVEKLGSLLFNSAYSSTLRSINVDKDNKFFTSKGGVLFTKDMTELITYPRYKTGKVYHIPDSVKVVRSLAFDYAKSLEKVVFSKSIKEVRKNVFNNCGSLKTIDLGDGMTDWDFVSTQGKLRTVILGKKVKTIASYYNFYLGYAKIKNFKVRKGNKYFAAKNGALLSKDLTHYYRYPGARKTDEYKLPDSVKVIEPCAFANIRIKNIEMPDRVVKIKKRAFGACGVQSVRLSKKLKSIGENCFAGASLRSVTIPSSVKTIGKSAFYLCTAMNKVTLKEGIKQVEDEAFLYCSKLSKITIPKSITKIGEHAFGYRDAWSWGDEDEDGGYSGDPRYFIHRHSYLIRGYKGSEAERYSNKNSIPFERIK